MTDHKENRLKNSHSPYLRSASHQPIDWHEWGEEAFAHARQADKPILLDIGAVWCHWCHVIDRESYENPEIAALINQFFVPVKVDRDERPDVDARYQSAVSAISGQGGWPLTAFLTPDGKPFFGGTYFPPDDAMGRPGFKRILLAQSPKLSNRDAKKWTALPAPSKKPWPRPKSFTAPAAKFDPRGCRRDDRIHRCACSMQRNGGFGKSPKFPHASRDRFASRTLPIHSRGSRCCMVVETHAGKDGLRRRLRSTRRRISSLFGRRALARPALRKNVLRQFRTAEKLSARLPGHRAIRCFAKSPKASSPG